MSFLRKQLLKPYYVKPLQSNKDDIGAVYEAFAEEGREIYIDLQPVTSKLVGEVYGLKVNEMLTGYTAERNIKIGDGVCVGVERNSEPDYRIVGVRKWNTHTVIDLEKR